MDNEIALPEITVLMSFSGAGGVERMVMNLVREFASVRNRIVLLVIRTDGPHFSNIPDNVKVVHLNAKHTLTAIPALVQYLRKNRPQSLLVAKDRAGRAAVIAKRIAGVETKIFVRLGTNLSTALQHRSGISAWWRLAPMRTLYKGVHKVIAVSKGVAADILKITKLDSDRVCVVRNPVVTKEFIEKSEVPGKHDWLLDKKCPVIIGVGRLSVQKDFGTLIKAFALVNSEIPCRLIILGEGNKRKELEELAVSLNISGRIVLPGFQENPMSWVKSSSCFVLSSRWEGSPNVLTEALALGVPCVSTRCPSGPDETLDNGRFGPLVDVCDAESMAKSILDVLRSPLPPDTLKSAVVEYHSAISAKKYLELLEGA